MKLRSKLTLAAVIPAVVALAGIATWQVGEKRVRVEQASVQRAEELTRSVSDLNFITDRYLIFREPHLIPLWKEQVSRVTTAATAMAGGATRPPPLRRIQASMEEVSETFDRIVAANAEPSSSALETLYRQRLSAALFITIRETGHESSRLQAEMQRQLRRTRERIDFGLVALFPLLAVVATLFSFFVARRLTVGLEMLEEGAKALAGGDYSVRIEKREQDEIGTLGELFNQMTEKVLEGRVALVENLEELEREVAERRRAQELAQAAHGELQLTTRRFQGIIEGTSDLVAAVDTDCSFITFNSAYRREFEKIFGCSIGAGTSLVSALDRSPADLQSLLAMWRRALGGEEFAATAELGDPERQRNVYDITFSALRDDAGRIFGAAHIVRDVTAKMRAEQALKESEELLRTVLDNLPIGVFLLDSRGGIRYRNDAAIRIWGHDSAAEHQGLRGWRHDCGSLLQRGDWPAARALETGETSLQEILDIENADGTRKVVYNSAVPIHSASGAITGAVVVNEDITEETRLREQLIHSQKMESVGLLAGGVAHEFNNILMAVIGYAEILSESLTDKPLQGTADIILSAGKKAALLTRKLLAFSRQQVISTRPVDINDLVGETCSFIGNLLGERITVSRRLCREPLPVVADQGQLEQVLTNIILNARDAMPEGGMLLVETEARKVEESQARGLGLKGGRTYATITVADTGTGMTSHQRERIFEPFYTTKEQGKGTGLGLPISFGIVSQHGGSIGVDSELGKGSVFTIFLPLSPPSAGAGETLADEGARSPLRITIAISGFDEGTASFIRSSLESEGYEAVVAEKDVADADLCLEKGPPDLIISPTAPLPAGDAPTAATPAPSGITVVATAGKKKRHCLPASFSRSDVLQAVEAVLGTPGSTASAQPDLQE